MMARWWRWWQWWWWHLGGCVELSQWCWVELSSFVGRHLSRVAQWVGSWVGQKTMTLWILMMVNFITGEIIKGYLWQIQWLLIQQPCCCGKCLIHSNTYTNIQGTNILLVLSTEIKNRVKIEWQVDDSYCTKVQLNDKSFCQSTTCLIYSIYT